MILFKSFLRRFQGIPDLRGVLSSGRGTVGSSSAASAADHGGDFDEISRTNARRNGFFSDSRRDRDFSVGNAREKGNSVRVFIAQSVAH